MTWDEAIQGVTHSQWNAFAKSYSAANHLKPVVGEWCLAINGDQVTLPRPEENNLFDGHLAGGPACGFTKLLWHTHFQDSREAGAEAGRDLKMGARQFGAAAS